MSGVILQINFYTTWDKNCMTIVESFIIKGACDLSTDLRAGKSTKVRLRLK